MNPTKRLTGACGECGGSIEFQAELVGTMTQCPRCRKQTELSLAVPPEEPAVPGRILFWTVAAIVIMVLALVVTIVGVNHYAKLAASQKARAAAAQGTDDTTKPAGFEVSAISLEKGQDGKEIYAVGTVVNSSERPRSLITVEFDLRDAGGHTLQILRAYRPVLKPGAKWEIRLPVAGDSKAVSARLASFKEGR
jgi:hypothetical protein